MWLSADGLEHCPKVNLQIDFSDTYNIMFYYIFVLIYILFLILLFFLISL